MVTSMVAAVGASVLRVLHLDFSGWTSLDLHGAKGDLLANEVMAEWIRRLVLCVWLIIGWGIVWISAHVLMVVVGGLLIWPGRGAPKPVLLLVEVIPGSLATIHILKFGMSFSGLLRYARAAGAAEKRAASPPPWTQRQSLAMRLIAPGDRDVLLAVALAAGIGFFGR